jgi:hypothetical protein
MCTSAQQHNSWDFCAHLVILVLGSPRTNVFSASRFWGINASLQYSNGDGPVTNLNTTAGFVDTGTTFLGLAAGKLLRDSDSYSMSELRYNIYVRRV